jgi:4-amino-4-deoxy-L-arabinose transferase-like glycosyltransferase
MALNRDRFVLIALVSILALALVLRMGWPTLAEFKRDEATVVRRALAIAYEGDLPAVGVGASMGTANLPLTLYLTAIPLRVSRDPVAAVLFIGLLNGLAVLACYAFAQAHFGRAVGLISSFLFAVNPWAVLFGRKLWCRTLPLATLAFFVAVYATFVRRRPWALVGVFAALAVLVGLQLEGIAFIPITLLLLLLYRRDVTLRPLIVGVCLFALAMSPYVVHDALHGWSSLRSFVTYARGDSRLSFDALRYAFFLTGSYGIHGMAGALYPEYLAGLPNLWWLNTLMMAALVVALLYALLRVVRRTGDDRRPLVLLLVWFVVPILLQTRSTAPVHIHYFVLLYPVQFLLIGILLVDGSAELGRALRSRFSTPDWRPLGQMVSPFALTVIVLLLLWGGWQVLVTARLFVFVEQHPTTGGYGIPLKYSRAAALQAQQLDGSGEIVVLSAGMDPAVDEVPSVFDALLFGRAHRFADGRSALPVPDAPQAVYLVGPVERDDGRASDLEPVLKRLDGMAYVRSAAIVSLPDGWEYQVFHRKGLDREDVFTHLARFPEPVTFANGVDFLGYGLPETAQTGETLELWIAWWLRSPPPAGSDYHFFAHLLDGQGQLLGQHDGAGFPTVSWRSGDLVLSRFPVLIPDDLSPGRYQVWAGQYTYPDVVNVPYLDMTANPAGDRVLVGEVSVETE